MMNVSQLIEDLAAIREEYGDIEVVVSPVYSEITGKMVSYVEVRENLFGAKQAVICFE